MQKYHKLQAKIGHTASKSDKRKTNSRGQAPLTSTLAPLVELEFLRPSYGGPRVAR
jgi:hypothetical protein